IPTTLPTLDELIGLNGIEAGNVAGKLLEVTAARPSTPPVYTLHTEMEGLQLLPVFESLLSGWKSQGYRLAPMRSLFESLTLSGLPLHDVTDGTVPGRSGTLSVQGTLASHV
ncbi:MAG TPA: hypothetical protein VK629_18440, partial [Steroidobacteraceae bacterium]|nr:hypothetical protein [Steroidobacteraceae bacterium]